MKLTTAEKAITSFQGEYRFLSNFYPCDVYFEGSTYPSVENAYQAAKADRWADRAQFYSCTPTQAKKRGRLIALRPDWESVKIDIMDALLHEKFKDPQLARMLLATGGAELVEGNGWGDTFWGVCNGKGENILGLLLMALREELRWNVPS